jgi:two-component system sensor histidine kinase UhpB
MDMLIGSLWPALAGTSDLAVTEAGRHALSPAQPVVEMEHRMRTGRGELRWMQFVNRAFFAADGKLSEIQAVGRDITERKRLEEALAESRAQLHALFEATDNLREQQRKEIARDIHDQLGTIHTAIGFRVEFVKDQFPENLLLANEMSGIKSLLIQAAAAARSICNNLRPPLLDDLGLIPACRWYLQEWSALIGIASSGRFSQISEEFPEQLSTDVYRVFQELLTNVAKHSGASRVRVTVHSGRRRLSLRVADNGRGFAPAAATPGYGLLGVRERMARQGGTVTIESGAAGTVVLITLPRPVAP